MKVTEARGPLHKREGAQGTRRRAGCSVNQSKPGLRSSRPHTPVGFFLNTTPLSKPNLRGNYRVYSSPEHSRKHGVVQNTQLLLGPINKLSDPRPQIHLFAHTQLLASAVALDPGGGGVCKLAQPPSGLLPDGLGLI